MILGSKPGGGRLIKAGRSVAMNSGVCICTHVRVYIYIYIYVSIDAHTYMYIYIYTYIYTYVYIYLFMYVMWTSHESTRVQTGYSACYMLPNRRVSHTSDSLM